MAEAAAGGNQDTGLFGLALACLRERDPDQKVELTWQAAADWRAGWLSLTDPLPLEDLAEPGRPERPELVPPGPWRSVPPRRVRAVARVVPP